MTDAASDLRDHLTRRRLVAALPSSHPRVLSFSSRWWDGACHVPCVVALAGGRRVRAVETHGGVLLLPASAGRARRVLHAWRRTPMGTPLAAGWGPLATGRGPARVPDHEPAGVNDHAPALVPGAQSAVAAPVFPLDGLAVLRAPRPSVRLRWQPVRLPEQRPAPEVVHITQEVDVASCPVARCGGLRVLPAPGQPPATAAASCPCCGLAA